MQPIVERQRHASPAPKPQSLAFDGSTLWMGSRETKHVYALDPVKWTARDEGVAPGTPWGIAVTGDELRVCCGEAPDDNRFIRRYVMGKGFDTAWKLACPDDTGSQLSYDGMRLYLSQWYNKRIVALDEAGDVVRTIDLAHEICGQVFANGHFYCITTDDETTGKYFLTRVEKSGVSEDIASIDFDARALTFDGTQFWTNHRDADQIVAFDVPGGI